MKLDSYFMLYIYKRGIFIRVVKRFINQTQKRLFDKGKRLINITTFKFTSL